MLSLKLRPFVLSFFEAGAPIVTRVSFIFPFCLLEMLIFPSIFYNISAFFFNGEYIVRSFLPNGVFLPCDHGLDF